MVQISYRNFDRMTPREKLRYIENRKKILIAYAREKLSPHFGYLDFISKFINNVQIKEEHQVDDLIRNLNKKNVIQSLPRGLQMYESLSNLYDDIATTSRHLKSVRFIKDNVASSSQPFFLSILRQDTYAYYVSRIKDDQMKSDIFKRWSSRIKSSSDAINYVKDIYDGSKYFDLKNQLEGVRKINGYDVYQMNDFKKLHKVMPVSWCIKKEEVFNRYKEDLSIMYMVVDKEGRIFGVNFPRHGSQPHIQDQNNNQLSQYSDKHKELTDLFYPHNWKDVKTGDYGFTFLFKVRASFRNGFNWVKELSKSFVEAILEFNRA